MGLTVYVYVSRQTLSQRSPSCRSSLFWFTSRGFSLYLYSYLYLDAEIECCLLYFSTLSLYKCIHIYTYIEDRLLFYKLVVDKQSRSVDEWRKIIGSDEKEKPDCIFSGCWIFVLSRFIATDRKSEDEFLCVLRDQAIQNTK